MLKRAFHAVFANLRLKLLAMVISVGIWFYANSRLTSIVDTDAGVDIMPPTGYKVLFQSQSSVHLRLSGPSWLITRLENEFSQRNIKLVRATSEGELANGWVDLKVESDWLKRALSESELLQVSLRSVSPKSIRVFASPEIEKVLPVKVVLSGEPASGYQMTQPALAAPSEVTAKGPAVALGSLQFIETEPIHISNLRSDLRVEPALKGEVPVRLENDTVALLPLRLSAPTVVVNVYVSGEKEQEQTFASVPVEFLTPASFPYAAEFQPGGGSVSVTVRASPQELKNLKPGSVVAYVDLGPLASERIPAGTAAPYAEEVVARLPEGVRGTVTRIEPARATLLLKRKTE
jgi:hypothetical protein